LRFTRRKHSAVRKEMVTQTRTVVSSGHAKHVEEAHIARASALEFVELPEEDGTDDVALSGVERVVCE
jgi:hypothetical protein